MSKLGAFAVIWAGAVLTAIICCPQALGAETGLNQQYVNDSTYAVYIARRANDYGLTEDAVRAPSVNTYSDWRANLRGQISYDTGNGFIDLRPTKVRVRWKCNDFSCIWQWLKK